MLTFFIPLFSFLRPLSPLLLLLSPLPLHLFYLLSYIHGNLFSSTRGRRLSIYEGKESINTLHEY
jgi:hypothetical protein